MDKILEKFVEVNGRPHQQELLSLVAGHRGYSNNDLFNYCNATVIYDIGILDELLYGTSLYDMCFSKNTKECIAFGKVMVPGVTPTGEVITFILYDIVSQLTSKIDNLASVSYYFPSSTALMKKGSFLYAPNSAWSSIVNSDDIFIVDGLWDSVALNKCGLPTLALLMSNLTEHTKAILKTFKHIYLVKDNDSAGTKLYRELLNDFSSVFQVVIPIDIAKDADDFIRVRGQEAVMSQIKYGSNTYLRKD